MDVVVFLLLVMAAGLGGFAVLARLGLGEAEAWAFGRVVGLLAAALAGWWAAVLGLGGWKVVGVAVLAVGAAFGAAEVWRRRRSWRELLAAEGVFYTGFVGVLLLRLARPEILATEKLMDLGIQASLLRTEVFPPPDMWLAGGDLPYYYWGSLLWTVPLWASRLAIGVGYNLVVAAVGGLIVAAAWALGRLLGAGKGGALAAFLAAFAGTPDGVRQLLAGRSPARLDLWESSRQVPDTITEFPLFTLWLGDLHPHLLSVPLALLTVAVALHCGRSGCRWPGIAVVAVAFGATWAANPWAMPPTLAGAALLLIAGDGRWHWPVGPGLWRWLAVLPVAAGGWLAMAPFHLRFDPPFQGLGAVRAWTLPADLLLYAGALLLPPAAAAAALLHRRGGEPELRRAGLLAFLATAVLLAAFLGSAAPEFMSGERAASGGLVTLVLLASFLGVLVASVVGRGEDPDRPALAIAALGLLLLAAPELVYVRDPYGDQLHRMNTVFKAYFQGWILLSLAAPVLLRRAFSGSLGRAVVTAVLVVSGLPHLISAAAPLLSGKPLGIDGLRWMDSGDRAAAASLRNAPPHSVLVEAVGDAYSEHARMSAASGVPAVLGWANHERVWRGTGVSAELDRRAESVQALYSCGDPERVRVLARDLEADLVVVGSLERAEFPAQGLEAVLAAGQVIIHEGGTAVVRPGSTVKDEAADG